MSPHVLELLLRELDVDPHDVVTVPGLLDLTALWRLVGVDRPDLKDEPFRPATAPRFAEGETAKSVFADAARGRRPRPPPVRLVRHQRPALHRAGRGRQERARDQADALPDVGRLPDRRRPQGRCGGGQAGRRAGGDQGAVRRAGQHPVGARAGALGRARRLRARRPQDALQDLPGGAPGGQPHPPLLPHRHGQLQPEDRAAVRRPRRADGGPGDRRRPHGPVQRPHRLLASDVVPEPARGALRRAARDHPAHRGRDRGAPRGQGRADPDQGELARRRAGDRRAVPGVAGRGAGGHRGARDLRDPARAGGASARTSTSGRSSGATSSTRGCSTSGPPTSTGSAART